MSTISVSTTAVSTTSTTEKTLVKNSKGEYTASSVDANQAAAQKLGLVKQTDGNYGTSAPKTPDPSKSAAAKSSSDVQAALSNLTLGG